MVPTDNSNSLLKVPNLREGGGHFGPKSPIGPKIDVKDFQKQLYDSIAGLIRSKKNTKKHGLKINWNRDIDGQSITVSGGKNFMKSKFPF